MLCLENQVLIWDGCTTKESNKIYINDLPGFDLSIPDYLSTQQVADGMQLMESKRRMASEFVKYEIQNFLNPRAQMATVVANQTAGYYREDRKLINLEANKYKGIQISLENYPYLSLYVNSISVFWDAAITTNVRVYNLTTGELLDTLPITTVANEPTLITVNKEYKNNGQFLNLIFVVDSSLADAYETTILPKGCTSCFARYELFNQYAGGRGIKINQSSTINNQSIQSELHTHGVSVDYSIGCDHDYFICNMANRFALPMFYKFGIEIMDEIIYSKRLNSLTTIHKDDAINLKVEYLLKYQESMNNVLNYIQIPNNICFNCTPFIAINTRIP